jgi:hypothetical protein
VVSAVLAKKTKIEFFYFFEKVSFLDCIRSKNLLHDLKNVKIAEKSLKIGQFYPILPTFYEFLKSRFDKSW